MSETSAAFLAGSSKQVALRLLRRRAFSAGYLGQVIDLAVREAARSQFDEPDEREATRIYRWLTSYAVNRQPGCTELARAVLDVKHAQDLVRHAHYRASVVPASGLDTTVTAEQLLELATDAGRARVLAAQGGVLVILAQNETASTVYRPVSVAQARARREAERDAKERAIRHHAGVVALLRPHVRMADWSKGDGCGVAVDVVRNGVSVEWWPASLPESWAMWEEGGIRQLCAELISARYSVNASDDGAHRSIVLLI
ncbi:hypothetical protein [Streptomyces californicus]|uniref:hypothetical protein n=1 Tax=Streptomyces californicus TaxID=67351 RepID=UPI0033CC878A